MPLRDIHAGPIGGTWHPGTDQYVIVEEHVSHLEHTLFILTRHDALVYQLSFFITL